MRDGYITMFLMTDNVYVHVNVGFITDYFIWQVFNLCRLSQNDKV